MILDTNALSAWADGNAELLPLLKQIDEVVLPVVVLGEYRYGISRSRFRSRYERWLSDFLPVCRLLPVDEETSEHYAQIRLALHSSGRPIPSNDAWIAALARQHKYPILSRDTHFEQVPHLKRITW